MSHDEQVGELGSAGQHELGADPDPILVSSHALNGDIVLGIGTLVQGPLLFVAGVVVQVDGDPHLDVLLSGGLDDEKDCEQNISDLSEFV